jgi:eukaryotic-like serine/threonine-protein kinase
VNGQTNLGKYTIVRKLGEGGMGEVYEGRHSGTGRRVAIKVITNLHSRNESLLQRFELEARAAGTIESEHIVAVLDVGRDETSGAPYLVMEYLVGEDVQHLSERLGPMPADLTMRVGVQALLGLAKAHAQGIVHRDIKPANLFLTERDGGELRVKVLDFGIAKVTGSELDSGEKKRPITRTGSFVGSPLYMSPEQTRGKGMVDHRSDLWSLGIVLYQMVAGRTPFDHIESLGDFIVAVRTTPVDPIRLHAPWVDPTVARAIERALVIDAAQRYQTADEMRAALAAFLPQGASITAAMLVPARPQEAPYTVMGAGTAMAATSPGAPLGAPALPTPAAIVHGTSSTPSGPVVPTHGSISFPSGPATPFPAGGTPAPQGSAPVAAGWPSGSQGGGVTPPPLSASLATLPSPQQAPAATGSPKGLLVAGVVGGVVAAAVAVALFIGYGVYRNKHKHDAGPQPSGVNNPQPPVVTDGGAAQPLPAELAALAGTWKSDGGLQYDADVSGDAIRFRIHDATTVAALGYEDGDVQFLLRAHPGSTATFRVEARMRPQPPAGASFDRTHAHKSCTGTWSEADGEPLRAEIEGDRLQVELVKVEAPASAFVREGGSRIKECTGLAQAPVVPTELWLSRGAGRDAGAPHDGGSLGWGASCTTDAQCASRNCFNNLCRRAGPGARCHADTNCASRHCVNTRCR